MILFCTIINTSSNSKHCLFLQPLVHELCIHYNLRASIILYEHACIQIHNLQEGYLYICTGLIPTVCQMPGMDRYDNLQLSPYSAVECLFMLNCNIISMHCTVRTCTYSICCVAVFLIGHCASYQLAVPKGHHGQQLKLLRVISN